MLEAFYQLYLAAGIQLFAAMEPRPDFQYTALEDASSHIRLLHILQDSDGKNVRCKCISYHLQDQMPLYTAISYTWGDGSFVEPIVLNDQRYLATKNAKMVLEYVRKREINAIWIDSVCIDQNNDTERDAQVRLMDRIYSCAQQTIVWLGMASNDSDLALGFVSTINDSLEALARSGEVTETLLLENTGTNHTSAPWQALGRLLARPYFQRIWVIQEIALSPNIQVVCGDETLAWTAFSSMVSSLLEHRLTHLLGGQLSTQQLTSGATTLWCMQNIKMQLKSFGRRKLSAVLFETMGFLATNARDQYFGILALVDSEWGNIVAPKYRDSVEDVYMKATMMSVQCEQNFDLIYLAGITHGRSFPSMPSWVPDFSHDILINPFGLSPPGRMIQYKAGGTSDSDAYQSPQFRGQHLVLYGAIIDEICTFGRARTAVHLEYDAEQCILWRDWVIEACELAQLHSKSENVWRTLIAGLAHPGKDLVPIYYQQYFEHFRRTFIDDVRFQDTDWKEAHALISQDNEIKDDIKLGASSYLFALLDASIGRRFCITKTDKFALAPSGCAIGDLICLVPGAPAPFVLRKAEYSFILVGDCYVDGLMAGEGMDDLVVEEILVR